MENIEIIEGCIKALKNKNKFFAKGNRNNFVYELACMCNRYGVPQSDFLRAATIKFQETSYTITEIRASVLSAYTKNLNEHHKYQWKQTQKTNSNGY